MLLKPNTWRRTSPRLATRAAAVLSCPTFITTIGVGLTAAWLTLLILTREYDSSPPVMVAVATATGLTWIWRMLLAYAVAEHRADDELIESVRRQRPDDEDQLREEEAFREIAKFFHNERNRRGLD